MTKIRIPGDYLKCAESWPLTFQSATETISVLFNIIIINFRCTFIDIT